ncbi:MAG: hypothetical protein IIB44_12670, partial [Candidatus Marinimicrobia bacterium]|nr:hypothetical protein [Candidatus Neomarinimicrobiota bacterium]
SRTLQAVWDLSDEDLGKVLYEYGKRRIKDKVLEGTITGHEELQFTTANMPSRCPFDPDMIKVLFNVPVEFPVDSESFAVIGKSPGLAGDIIDLRDNINALFHEHFKCQLLLLPQERHLLELFLRCDNREDFGYRVASLGGLAVASNSTDLRSLVSVKENSQSLDVLGAFLRSKFSNEDTSLIMDSLKRFNHLRRMYPVHTDRATGVLEAFQYFGLTYPIRDYRQAWTKLLEAYKTTLQQVLELIKQIKKDD